MKEESGRERGRKHDERGESVMKGSMNKKRNHDEKEESTMNRQEA